MKRVDRNSSNANAVAEPSPVRGSNGASHAVSEISGADLSLVLSSLQTMRDGTFRYGFREPGLVSPENLQTHSMRLSVLTSK